MADDVTSGEYVFATDEISDRHFPKEKLVYGADGTATDVTLTSGLPVQPGTSTTWVVANAGAFAVQAEQSGTWNIGTVTAVTAITNALPAGTNAIGKLAANSGVDIGDVDVTSLPSVTSATTTQVASSATNVTLKASNAARTGLSVFNDSTQILYLKLGATASSTSYMVKMAAGSYWELPLGRAIYTGIVDGIWASANGNAYVTEW